MADEEKRLKPLAFCDDLFGHHNLVVPSCYPNARPSGGNQEIDIANRDDSLLIADIQIRRTGRNTIEASEPKAQEEDDSSPSDAPYTMMTTLGRQHKKPQYPAPAQTADVSRPSSRLVFFFHGNFTVDNALRQGFCILSSSG